MARLGPLKRGALGRWARESPNPVGWLCIVLSLTVGSIILYRHLHPPEKFWHEYSVATVEKITIPYRSGPEHSFHLHLADAGMIGIDSVHADHFHVLDLQHEPKPTPVDVFSDHLEHNGLIWAEGIRLRNGMLLLDPAAVKSDREDDDGVGFGLCALLLICGIGLQFYPAQARST